VFPRTTTQELHTNCLEQDRKLRQFKFTCKMLDRLSLLIRTERLDDRLPKQKMQFSYANYV
jgi:hypothetical protein